MLERARVLFTESSRNVGGQELQFFCQMEELQRRGHEVRLACLPQSAVWNGAEIRGFKVEPVLFRNSLHIPSVVKVRKIIAEWRPAAVVCHSGHDANVVAIAARTVAHRPRIVRSRTYQHGVPHAWTYNWFSDVTVVPSEEMRSRILRNPRIRPDHIHVLYPGFAFNRLDAEARQPLPEAIRHRMAQLSGPVIIHPAMLRPEKGHLTMLPAVKAMIGKYPGLQYVIAGDGEMLDAIRNCVDQLGIGKHVFLAGVVSPVAPLLAKADLVVMPSTYEPLGMSQTEALALQIPVVASRTGGIPETIQDGITGLLVDPGDSAAWLRSLSFALANLDEMRAMARAGSRFVREKFSIERNVDMLERLAAI